MTLNRTVPIWLGLALLIAGAGAVVAVERFTGGQPLRTVGDAQASEQAIERGSLSPAEQAALMRSMAEYHLERRDYPAAVMWAQRYLKAGGGESDIRPLLVQAYLRSGDYANAARELQWEVQAAERSGRAPAEDRLLLLRSCYAKLNDANAFAWSLEKLVTYYPRPDYWADLLERTERRPDFGEPLALDVNRLRLRVGALTTAAGYLRLASQAQQAGYAAEARAAVEQGLSKGVLGTGADAARHRQLLQQLTEAAAAQQRRMADPQVLAAAEKAKDGIELLDLGFSMATLGKFDRGLELMEQGIRKGGLANRPQIARLHLGMAYLMAGDKAKAGEIFKAVGGRHGGADLGRLWAIHTQNLR